MKEFESKVYEKLDGKMLEINQNIKSIFYEDCNNFLDRIHLSEKGISKIDFKTKLNNLQNLINKYFFNLSFYVTF